MKKWVLAILGVDDALFHALLARVWQACSGAITLFLILRVMPPMQQGFYYTFNSVLNLQVFFELGLSFVILQSTTHYFSDLQWSSQGDVIGNDIHVQKWFSFLRKSAIAYFMAAMCFAGLLIPVGLHFFALRSVDAMGFTWRAPWVFLVLGTALNLCLTPFLAALEGSGKVAEIYRFRWKQLMLANVTAWMVLFLGYGLLMVAVGIWVNAVLTTLWLFKTHKKFVSCVIKRSKNKPSFVWSKEIWPMQWRIAVSWMSGYFISQAFTPLLFYYQGAIVSGQMGICLSLLNLLSLFGLTWINVRSPKMGQMVARRDWAALNQLFTRVFWQSAVAFVIVSGCLLGAVCLVSHSPIANRFLPMRQIVMLLMSTFFTHMIGSLSLYLRAHRTDPFVFFSVIGALLLAVSSWYGAYHYGSFGVCCSMLIVNGLYGFPSSVWLWQRCKRRWHTVEEKAYEIEAYHRYPNVE